MKKISLFTLTLSLGILLMAGSQVLAQGGKPASNKGNKSGEVKTKGNQGKSGEKGNSKHDAEEVHSDAADMDDQDVKGPKDKGPKDKGPKDKDPKDKDPKADHDHDHGDADHDHGKPEKDKADKGNNGNAYGKNKGDLEGKEFGQARAEEAKAKKEEKKEELTTTVDENLPKVDKARAEIKAVKEKLEKDKKAGRITATEYEEKQQKIEQAEKVVNDLDAKLKHGKELQDK